MTPVQGLWGHRTFLPENSAGALTAFPQVGHVTLIRLASLICVLRMLLFPVCPALCSVAGSELPDTISRVFDPSHRVDCSIATEKGRVPSLAGKIGPVCEFFFPSLGWCGNDAT